MAGCVYHGFRRLGGLTGCVSRMVDHYTIDYTIDYRVYYRLVEIIGYRNTLNFINGEYTLPDKAQNAYDLYVGAFS